MAITLRNKAIEAKIKEIGRRTGLGPSAVIARAIDHEELREQRAREELVAHRQAAGQKLRAMLPKLSTADQSTIDQEMSDIYDKDGLPK